MTYVTNTKIPLKDSAFLFDYGTANRLKVLSLPTTDALDIEAVVFMLGNNDTCRIRNTNTDRNRKSFFLHFRKVSLGLILDKRHFTDLIITDGSLVKVENTVNSYNHVVYKHYLHEVDKLLDTYTPIDSSSALARFA